MIRVSPVFIALAILLPLTAEAQGGSGDDNILYPQPPLPMLIGPEIGFAQWKSDASFVVGDAGRACAAFSDGEGNGVTVGMCAFLYLTEWIAVTPRLRYEPRLLKFVAPLDPEPVRDARDSVVMLTREGQADATISTFTLDLRVAVDLFASGFYLAGGPSANLMASSFYDYTERFTGPPGVIHGDSRDNEQTLATGRAFENGSSVTLDLRGGVGFLLPIGSFVLNPEASYTVPITSALAAPDTLKQRGFSASFSVMFNFGETR
jgi:hypothetical protein